MHVLRRMHSMYGEYGIMRAEHYAVCTTKSSSRVDGINCAFAVPYSVKLHLTGMFLTIGCMCHVLNDPVHNFILAHKDHCLSDRQSTVHLCPI